MFWFDSEKVFIEFSFLFPMHPYFPLFDVLGVLSIYVNNPYTYYSIGATYYYTQTLSRFKPFSHQKFLPIYTCRTVSETRTDPWLHWCVRYDVYSTCRETRSEHASHSGDSTLACRVDYLLLYFPLDPIPPVRDSLSGLSLSTVRYFLKMPCAIRSPALNSTARPDVLSKDKPIFPSLSGLEK